MCGGGNCDESWRVKIISDVGEKKMKNYLFKLQKKKGCKFHAEHGAMM